MRTVYFLNVYILRIQHKWNLLEIELHTTTGGSIRKDDLQRRRISSYSANDIWQSICLEFHPTLYDTQLSRPHHKSIITERCDENIK